MRNFIIVDGLPYFVYGGTVRQVELRDTVGYQLGDVAEVTDNDEHWSEMEIRAKCRVLSSITPEVTPPAKKPVRRRKKVE